ncbi:MAG: TetR/AcrR family transcriptional regulator [Nocardioides sp.]|uniref:TetR/AcrR family transcriptional regulator n=1 Tax=Nocardioides sp. TaxID=35761 RepID=UPI0039E726A1
MPKIAAASVAEHRAAVRRRIFEAFAELMASSSYDAITMAQLAERSGLGRTAIYHHFHDKDAVVVAFATEETSRYLEALRGLLASTSDPAERLRIYLRNHLDSGERFHMGLGPQLYGILPNESKRAIHEHVVAVEEVLRDILQAGVDRGQFVIDDLDATTSLIHACLGSARLPAASVERFILRAVGLR